MSTDEYPTLGFDPAPGTPASVNDLATKLSTAVTGLAHANTTLTSIAKGGDACVWEGETATAFSKKVGDLPRYLTDSHDALKSAATQLTTWHKKLVEYQTTARRYESEAKAAKARVATAGTAHDHSISAYNQAASDPASQLVGKSFATQADAQAAQAKIDAAGARLRHADHTLDTATKQLNAARDELDAIVQKAKDLLDHHQSQARTVAAQLRKADGNAPDPSIWAKLGDLTKKAGHHIKDWCTKHADLLKTIGDWMGTASAVLGVAALATMWCPPLAGGLALAGGIAAGGALAAHGAAKLGGADVGVGTLVGDGVGIIPAGKFGFTAIAGARVGTKFAQESLTLRGGRTVEAITQRIGGLVRPMEGERAGFNKLLRGREATLFPAKSLKYADRMRLAWHVNTSTFSQGSLTAVGLSDVFTKTPLRKIPGVSAAVRPDGTLDPMSWWSRGPQIGQKLRGVLEKGNDAIHPDFPAASSLG